MPAEAIDLPACQFIGGCTLARYHPGLCSVPALPARRRLRPSTTSSRDEQPDSGSRKRARLETQVTSGASGDAANAEESLVRAAASPRAIGDSVLADAKKSERPMPITIVTESGEKKQGADAADEARRDPPAASTPAASSDHALGVPPDLPSSAEVSLMSVGALKALLSRHRVAHRSSDKKWKLLRLAQALVEEHAEVATRGALEMAVEWGRSADGAAYVVEAPMEAAYESWCNLCGRVRPALDAAQSGGGGRCAATPWYKCVECVGFEVCPECRATIVHPHRLVVPPAAAAAQGGALDAVPRRRLGG